MHASAYKNCANKILPAAKLSLFPLPLAFPHLALDVTVHFPFLFFKKIPRLCGKRRCASEQKKLGSEIEGHAFFAVVGSIFFVAQTRTDFVQSPAALKR